MENSNASFAAILDAHARASAAPPAPVEPPAPAAKKQRTVGSSVSFGSPAPIVSHAATETSAVPPPFSLLDAISSFSSVHALAAADLAVLVRMLEADSNLDAVAAKLNDVFSLGLADSGFPTGTAPDLGAALIKAAKIKASTEPLSASGRRGKAGKPE